MAKQFLLSLFLAAGLLLPRYSAAQARPPAMPGSDTLITAADTAICFADSVFRRPGFHFQHIEPDLPPNIQDILIRFNNALSANRQWFLEYKKYYEGKPLPYNERFGISIAEYMQLQNLEKTPPQLVPVDTQKVSVIRDAANIYFKSEGDIHLLDYLQIDKKNRLIIYGGDTIPLLGRTVTELSSPYGRWRGYTWRMQKVDAASAISTSTVTARVVEINLGLTDPATRVFLRIKYQSLREGATTANLELAGYIY